MSVKSWMREFYKTEASVAARGSWLSCAEHSLVKWEGLRRSKLRRHKVKILDVFGGPCLVDDFSQGTEKSGSDTMFVNSLTCSLCLKAEHHCERCPLFVVRGWHNCTEMTDRETRSPWFSFIDRKDPGPMIKWLKRAIEMIKKDPNWWRHRSRYYTD